MPYQLSHPNNVEDPDSADDADVHLVEVQEGDGGCGDMQLPPGHTLHGTLRRYVP